MNELLTIGIPVFEEADGLAKTITSIENLTEFRAGIIKVVIWDNHSQDDSEKVATKFAARYPDKVLVGHNSTNVGAVGNIIQVLKNSNSKFVWILGAGEELINSTLKPLLDFLDEPRNSDVVMGTVKADSGPGSKWGASPEWNIKRVEPETDSCFVETISLSIVDRNLALKVLEVNHDLKRSMNYVWPHLEVALSATSAPTFKLDYPALVNVSGNPTGWWYHGPKALDYYLNQVMLLKNHPRPVEWVTIRLKDRTGWHFAKFAFEIKLEGAGLRARSLISAFRTGIGAGPTLTALAIALIPKPLLRIAQTIFRKAQKK